MKENDIPRAIASSAPPENVRFTLEKTATKKYFDVVLDESSFKKGKPDPEIYVTTAGLIHYPPDRCVVFEDSLAGVEAARRADCKVVGVTTTHPRAEFFATDLVIDDFIGLELQKLFKLFH